MVVSKTPIFHSILSKLIFALFLLFFSTHSTAEIDPWTGSWKTVWRNDGAQMTLTQDGDQVTGYYEPYEGLIKATAKGRVLEGEWIQKTIKGKFIFTLAPDGKTFLGRFDSGEWWNGEKINSESSALVLTTELESPMTSLKSFLSNFNLVHNGYYQYAESAQKSLDYSYFENASPRERVFLSEQLFSIIDQATLRVWDLPQTLDLNQFNIEFQQMGSTVSIPIEFKKDADKNWRILIPPKEAMDLKVKELLDARNKESFEQNAHLNLSNPRDTIRTFVQQIERWDNGGRELVFSTMDLSNISESIRTQEATIRAEHLKQILDRISYIIWQEIPNDPNSKQEYLHFMHPLGNIRIAPYIIDGKTVWKFDAETIGNVKNLHLAFEDMPLVEGLNSDTQLKSIFKIRQAMRSYPWLMVTVFGTEIWQWLSLIVITGLSWIFSKYIALLFIKMVRSVRRLLRIRSGNGKVTEFYGPLRITLIATFWKLSTAYLGLPETLFLVVNWASSFAMVLGLSWMALRATDWYGQHHRVTAMRTKTHMDDIMVSLIVGLIKVIIVAVSAVMLAKVIAIPYQSILAGLGIGGLAIAFAARETIADFFGSAVLLADRPFRQNDRVNIGEVQGYIEHVGLRSTQIRTLDDSIVTMPNSRLAHEVIDNRKQRNARHFKTRISVTHETSAEKLEFFAKNIKELVFDLDECINEKVHCGIWEFGPSSIDLQLFCYLKADTREDEYNARNCLMNNIIKLARKMDIKFAFPTQTLYVHNSEEKSRPITK